ncbi:ABC transporter permease [Roseomonas sp. CCTCC AB2023176]|uniref:ABC transporter permease n=1 Tax=Roseomonas sp. CCTCC AB2023176 TaxID=3342640 RepID=UPI0035DAB2A8
MILALPYALWLLAAFAAPLAAVALMSVQESQEPFTPLSLLPDTAQYAEIATDPFLLRTLGQTVALGAGVTLASACLAYPVALWLTRLAPRWRPWGFALVLVPLLTNVVVRSLGIILLLAPGGPVGWVAESVGLPRPNLLFGWFAVGLSLTQVFMPYLVLSLYDVLEGADRRLPEAASGLGAGPAMRFLRVTLPLSLGGLRAGLTVVFLLASTAYVSATLVGGRKVTVTGMIIYREALENLNVPLASALSMTMLAISVVSTLLIAAVIGGLMPWARGRPRRPARGLPPMLRRALVRAVEAVGPWVGRLLLAIGVALLVFPLLLVAVASVNDVRQATVASFHGFTWRWYAAIWDNRRYLGDFRTSLELAAATTAISLLLALPASFALVRGAFRGREALGAALMLPLALPGIAIGLGMLRLLQWFVEVPPFLGMLAVHVVLVAPFVLAMLRASVATLDRSLEEAAGGLGAPPRRVLWRVILPQLAPGLVVAGLLGFLISFGEVTVTAFLVNARLQTLPVRIYAEATFSLENTVNALATLTILMTVGLLLVVNRFVRLDRVWKR